MARIDTGPLEVIFQSLMPRYESPSRGKANVLSFGGAVIASDDLPPLGAILELRILDDSGAEVTRVFGEVKWHIPPESDRSGSFGLFYLLPTTGRMLDLVKLHLKSGDRATSPTSEPGD